MKKRYISPETVAVKMETANMIALSATLSTQQIESSDDFGARGGGGGWDDED